MQCPRPWVERVGPPVVRLRPLLTAVGEGLRISAAGRRPLPATFGVLEEKGGPGTAAGEVATVPGPRVGQASWAGGWVLMPARIFRISTGGIAASRLTSRRPMRLPVSVPVSWASVCATSMAMPARTPSLLA